MNKYAFIHQVSGEKMVGIIEDNKLVSYKNFSTLSSNIYRVRVEKYIKSLDAFIVDLGLDKNGLLRRKNAKESIKPSDQLIVELIEEKEGDKLYEVTEKFSITDGYLVLKNNIYKEDKYDLFLRTRGKNLEKAEKLSLENALKSEFFSLKKQVNFYPTPKLLRQNTKLREFVDSFDGIVYNNIEDIKIEKTIRDIDYDEKYNLDIMKGLNEVSDRVIKLEEGLELVFDKTEACEVIDINTGAFNNALNKSDLSYQANTKVLDDLARVISIKNIKKMIIIDFIRMDHKSHKNELFTRFKEKLEKYNVKSQLLGFTKMGLFEMIVQ